MIVTCDFFLLRNVPSSEIDAVDPVRLAYGLPTHVEHFDQKMQLWPRILGKMDFNIGPSSVSVPSYDGNSDGTLYID